MDHNRWRKQIGMIDDHNRCEWVNVSSGTGSPGLTGQNPKSHKMVVCLSYNIRKLFCKSGSWVLYKFCIVLYHIVGTVLL